MLRETLARILADYPAAAQSPLKKHPLAGFLRDEPTRALLPLANDPQRFKIEGSPGITNRAKVPWISIFDLLVTDSAQRGYYPVYLFRRDMLGVYLSLNQGVTKVRELYGPKARMVLRSRADEFRAALGSSTTPFTLAQIDLAVSQSDTASYYLDGNILATYYERARIPTEDQLVADFLKVLDLYRLLVDKYAAGLPIGEDQADEDDVDLMRLAE